jgi:hypothetical protein
MTDLELRELDWQVHIEVMNVALKDALPIRANRCAPRYSTDIAAAWQVVEKIGELNWPCMVTVRQFRGGDYRCDIDSNADNERLGERRWLADAHSAPLAICLAALKAARTAQ